MYLIKTIDPNYKLDNSKSHELGFIAILWRNYFGDQGILKVGPYRSSKVPTTKDGKPIVEAKKEIEV